MYLVKNRRLKSFTLVALLIFSMLFSGCSANQEQYVVSEESQQQDESPIDTGDAAAGDSNQAAQDSAQVGQNSALASQSYKVLRVVDGDTIVVSFGGKSEKVRMIGINTPESVHADESKNTPEGKIASEFTKSKLEGKTVQLEFDAEERDKYGRLLAYVWIDGVMFNKTLLSEGYAKIATFPPNVKYVDDFKALERQARELKKGFWGDSAASSPPSSVSGGSSSASNAPTPPAQAAYAFMGNSNSMKFHDADCEWAQKISPANRVTFSHRQDAINSGYVPCKVCNP
ncbi:thermonuclease family protein [Peptoclostridium acidaminophilum]|nr:thermonuclease family protein [Peptoclostridium acidaminophilum]